MFLTVVAALALAACGGGGSSIADEAEERSEAACACTGFDCTMEHVAWFNKVGAIQEDDLEALSADDRARYEAARGAAAACQDELR